MSRTAVMGAGAWGTAFSIVLADAGNDVRLWARRTELTQVMTDKRRNLDHLPDADLPGPVRPTSEAVEALADAELVFLAVPSQRLREHLTDWAPLIRPDAVLVSLAKGVELTTTKRMSEVIAGVTGAGDERIAVLTGPNLADEVAARQPAATVVACARIEVAARIQEACHTEAFRPYIHTDVTGAELGGAVKNVIALAVGMAHGMGLGDNAKAALMTRGMAETARLGVALGADPYTFAGLAGMGDLVATCQSPLSRNRRFGERLGAGAGLAELVSDTRQVVEGVKSCEAIGDLARLHGVDMPIVFAVASAVRDGVAPAVVLRRLMARSAKPERDEHMHLGAP
jgi:glycerol-3-phosphate dehydrogenase (NAD(P)+)